MNEPETSNSASASRRASEMGKVYVALLRDRRNLRRAGRFSGDPKLKRLLRRLAFRRARIAEDLGGAPQIDIAAESFTDSEVEALTRDLGTANEIGTLAACLRSNRRLRIAIERALASTPPPRTAKQLTKLRDSASREAGTLEARLGEIAMRGFGGTPPQAE